MDSATSNRTPLAAIIYMIHHIFLPPKLPQEDDFDPQHEKILLNTVGDTLRTFKAAAGYGQRDIIESVSAMMENLKIVRDESGAINEKKLGSTLRKLSQTGMISALPT